MNDPTTQRILDDYNQQSQLKADAERWRKLAATDHATMLEWLRAELVKRTRELKAREDSAETWGSGTEEMWRSCGSTLTRKQRLQEANKERRIAARIKCDVAVLESLVALVTAIDAAMNEGK